MRVRSRARTRSSLSISHSFFCKCTRSCECKTACPFAAMTWRCCWPGVLREAHHEQASVKVVVDMGCKGFRGAEQHSMGARGKMRTSGGKGGCEGCSARDGAQCYDGNVFHFFSRFRPPTWGVLKFFFFFFPSCDLTQSDLIALCG